MITFEDSQYLSQLLSNRNVREKMGKKAFERSKKYSWDQTISSLLRAIDNFFGFKLRFNSHGLHRTCFYVIQQFECDCIVIIRLNSALDASY